MTNIFWLAFIVVTCAIYWCWFRNMAVCKVRKSFIWTEGFFPGDYESLPSYEAMLYHPRYQHLWTKAQWVTWVKAQEVAA